MRELSIYITLLLAISCDTSRKDVVVAYGNDVFRKSIAFHDPNGKWDNASFSLRIQEPRTKNPDRHSLISLDNESNTFTLRRQTAEEIITYRKQEEQLSVLIDNQWVFDTTVFSRHGIKSGQIELYHDFYKTMLGLPMSLEDRISNFGEVSSSRLGTQAALKVPIELKKPLFSGFWCLYISEADFSLLAIEIVYPDKPDKGERIEFGRNFEYRGINIPRIRQWYNSSSGSYLGADILFESEEPIVCHQGSIREWLKLV